MLTKLLVISIDASRVLGVSSKVTILLYEGCRFVLRIFISLYVSEKNATSEPATKNEIIKSRKRAKIRIVVAPSVMTRYITNEIRIVPVSDR